MSRLRSSTKRIITRARRCGLVAAHLGCAALAPSTASASSAAEASGTRACTSPVAGLKTSANRPEVPDTRRPLMKWLRSGMTSPSQGLSCFGCSLASFAGGAARNSAKARQPRLAILQMAKGVLEERHAKKHALGRSQGVLGGGAAQPAPERRAGCSDSTRPRSDGGSARSRPSLGTRLFDRSPQGYALTETGRSLLGHAQAIESQAGEAAAEIGGQTERLSGTVRIGAPDGVSNYLLIDACDALSRDNPDLQVQVVALPRIFSLSKREADLAITVSPPTAGRLTVRKIADYRLRLYARADLVAALGPVRTMADLRASRGIGYISDMIFDQRARLLRAARTRARAGADLEQPAHAAALVPARLRDLHPARFRRARASRARRCSCRTTSG